MDSVINWPHFAIPATTNYFSLIFFYHFLRKPYILVFCNFLWFSCKKVTWTLWIWQELQPELSHWPLCFSQASYFSKPQSSVGFSEITQIQNHFRNGKFSKRKTNEISIHTVKIWGRQVSVNALLVQSIQNQLFSLFWLFFQTTHFFRCYVEIHAPPFLKRDLVLQYKTWHILQKF